VWSVEDIEFLLAFELPKWLAMKLILEREYTNYTRNRDICGVFIILICSCLGHNAHYFILSVMSVY